jgi:hypothetical protein
MADDTGNTTPTVAGIQWKVRGEVTPLPRYVQRDLEHRRRQAIAGERHCDKLLHGDGAHTIPERVR